MKNTLRILFFGCLLRPLFWFLLGVNVFGRENLPRKQQFIMVANHNSHLDALLLLNLFPLHRIHQIHPVAASDYFMANPVVAWLTTTLINIVPIPRTGITKSNNPLTRMGEILAQGDSLILFPEGSRGEPEEMKPFRSGIAHVVAKHPEIPVVPVFVYGAGKSLPKGEMLPVPFFCDIAIGPAMCYAGTRDEIVQQVEQAVRAQQEMLEDRFMEPEEVTEV